MYEPPETESVQDQLVRAARDLWTMVFESGEDYVVFMDVRRVNTRVQRLPDGQFGVLWEVNDEDWLPYERTFENPREAAFHAYQGPH